MPRILVRLTLAPAVPSPVVPRLEGEVVSSFGRWLRERVASAAVEWPGVAVHRLHLTSHSLELVLLADPTTPPLAGGLGLARGLSRELDLAARRTGWIRGPLWSDLGVWVAARGTELVVKA